MIGALAFVLVLIGYDHSVVVGTFATEAACDAAKAESFVDIRDRFCVPAAPSSAHITPRRSAGRHQFPQAWCRPTLIELRRPWVGLRVTSAAGLTLPTASGGFLLSSEAS